MCVRCKLQLSISLTRKDLADYFRLFMLPHDIDVKKIETVWSSDGVRITLAKLSNHTKWSLPSYDSQDPKAKIKVSVGRGGRDVGVRFRQISLLG